MKYRIFSVLMILAMVASLSAIAALPASAAVTVDGVTVTPALANQQARYDVQITPSGALGANDEIHVMFDSAVQLPSSIDASDVYLNTSNLYTKGGDVTVSGNDVIILPGTGGFTSGTISFTQGAGIINPQLSQEGGSPYEIDVWTSDEPTPVTGYFNIWDWASASPKALEFNQETTVVGAGFTAGSTAYASGAIQGQGTVQSDGTFSFTAYGAGSPTATTATIVETATGRSTTITGFSVVPRLEVVPTEGTVGSQFGVKGYDFINPGSVMLVYDGSVLVPTSYLLPLEDLDNDNNLDDFSSGGLIPPTLPGGNYVISCTDFQGTNTPTATASFEVYPHTVAITPASGAPGSGVTVEGSGFAPPSDLLEMYYGDYSNGIAIMLYGNTMNYGIIAQNIEVDDQGNFSAVGNIPDDAMAGMRGVVVFFDPNDNVYDGTDPDELAAQTFFTVTGRLLSVVPNSGPFGTDITLSGGDFGSGLGGKFADLKVNGVPVGQVELSSTGDIVPESMRVEDAYFNYGINVVSVEYDSMSASGYFTGARPTISLDKDQGPRGTQVVVEGSGWFVSPQNFVTLATDYNADGIFNDVMQLVQPDGNGDIYAQVTISSDATPGNTIQILASDGKDNTALKESFLVTAPTVEVDPEAAPVGSEIMISGTGFAPLTPIMAIMLGGVNIVWGQDLPITNSEGGFEVTGLVPGLSPGGKALTVTDASNFNYTVPFTITGDGEVGAIDVEDGLATIDGLYTRVWTFDSATQEWQVYDTAEGAPDDFTTLTKGQGYWIEVTEDCTLSYGAATYNLHEGWNLIGWLG